VALRIQISPIATEPKLQILSVKTKYLAPFHFVDNVNLSQGNKTVPEMDEFTLQNFEAEWRTARQRMLNLKFDSEW